MVVFVEDSNKWNGLADAVCETRVVYAGFGSMSEWLDAVLLSIVQAIITIFILN